MCPYIASLTGEFVLFPENQTHGQPRGTLSRSVDVSKLTASGAIHRGSHSGSQLRFSPRWLAHRDPWDARGGYPGLTPMRRDNAHHTNRLSMSASSQLPGQFDYDPRSNQNVLSLPRVRGSL